MGATVDRWEVTRARGRHHFILWHGVICWGVSTAILWALLMSFVFQQGTFLLMLAVGLVLFPIGGYVWGAMMWRWAERRRAQGEAAASGRRSDHPSSGNGE